MSDADRTIEPPSAGAPAAGTAPSDADRSDAEPSDADPSADLLGRARHALARQYHAGLAMLRDGLERYPEARWRDTPGGNAVWQLVYHTLFFTDLYLRSDAGAFEPFPGHQADAQHPDGLPGPADPRSALPLLPDPYPKAHLLAYAEHLIATLDERLAALDLLSATSGFTNYPISKLEHQLVTLRHLQHHAGQVAARVREATGEGVAWVGSGPRPRTVPGG
jgi:hypothetical protein